MRLRPTSFLVMLLALTFLLPGQAEARKRRHHKRTSALLKAVEPDAMVAKANAERKMIASVATKEVSNKAVNTRFREGIDVSRYQGFINWDQVAGSEQISYAYLKATEGASLVDVTYKRNLREARRVGLSVGSYHFYRPNIDWRTQFDNLTSAVRAGEQDLVPIIDIETRGRVSHEKFIRDLEKFVKAVTRHYGKKPLLYTFQNFYNKHLCGCFSDYHWMIARYQDDAPTLHDGKDYIIWQYTASGEIPGVEGDVDRSRIMGDFSLWQLEL